MVVITLRGDTLLGGGVVKLGRGKVGKLVFFLSFLHKQIPNTYRLNRGLYS